MTTAPGSVTPQWLWLREPADAAARSSRLVESLVGRLPTDEPLVVHDLGCGSGSMGRWLAPRLPGSQRWVLHDRDAALLEVAVAHPPMADSHEIAVETRRTDLTDLTAADLSDASFVTASALLDILTADELRRLVRACLGTGRPALLTLSVTGEVHFSPPDPLDAELRAAFNDHQRRTTGGRSLLGPDAPRAAVEAFVAGGAEVEVAASDWRLDAGSPELLIAWLEGWVDAAREQRADLAPRTDAFIERCRERLAERRLTVTVRHVDLLAWPRSSR